MRNVRISVVCFLICAMFSLVQMGCMIGGPQEEVGKVSDHYILTEQLPTFKHQGVLTIGEHVRGIQEIKKKPVMALKNPGQFILPINQTKWLTSLWKGQKEQVSDKTVTAFSIHLKRSGKLARVLKRKPAGWSLFRVAHACGPYAPTAKFQILADVSFLQDGKKLNLQMTGTASSFSKDFRSVSVQLNHADGWLLHGNFYKNTHSKKLIFNGSIFQGLKKKVLTARLKSAKDMPK
mgnify:CR=1 FL=1